MPAFKPDTNRCPVYRKLTNARPAGPAVGSFRGQVVSSAIVDASGRRYVYAGVVPRSCNGHYEVDLLGPDESIVEPGLIYRATNQNDSLPWVASFRAQLPQTVLTKALIGLVGRLTAQPNRTARET